jgi:hypothetical protein
MCVDFNNKALVKTGKSLHRLLGLVASIVEDDPLASLRLLQANRVHRFDHIMAADPPNILTPFSEARDKAVRLCFEAAHDFKVSVDPINVWPSSRSKWSITHVAG